MTFAGTQFPVTAGNPTGMEGNRRRIRAAKATGLPLIPWSKLKLHENSLWRVGEGVPYLRGVDSITVHQAGVNRTYNERPDAYGVDNDGVPLSTLVKVPLEDVAEWEASATQVEANKKLVRERDPAVLAEFLGRKNRDYSVARIAGSAFSSGVNLPELKGASFDVGC